MANFGFGQGQGAPQGFPGMGANPNPLGSGGFGQPTPNFIPVPVPVPVPVPQDFQGGGGDQNNNQGGGRRQGKGGNQGNWAGGGGGQGGKGQITQLTGTLQKLAGQWESDRLEREAEKERVRQAEILAQQKAEQAADKAEREEEMKAVVDGFKGMAEGVETNFRDAVSEMGKVVGSSSNEQPVQQPSSFYETPRRCGVQNRPADQAWAQDDNYGA